MRSFSISRVFDKHTRSVAAAIGLLLATLVPALAPAFVSADQVTDRSIELSSSAKGATGVSYKFNFTTTNAAQSLVVEFCSNTPLIGEACTNPNTTPGAFTVAGATSSDATITNKATANKLVMEKDMSTPGTFSIAVGGINNPSAAGALYARIVTYDVDGATALTTYASTAVGTHADEGGVALSITNGVNVSGAVLETMTFCVSGETLAANCVGGGAAAPNLTAPTLKLGKDTAGVIALDSDDVYEGTIYTQLSTNAAKGAIVSLKSSAAGCGGLIRSSDTAACDIGPAGTTGDIAAGVAAKFGLKLGADVTDATNGDIVAASTDYNNTNFRLKYVDNSSGVTSTYGDPILKTNGKPANNRNMPLTFGATVTNNTPAGSYSADLSLVATGTF